MSGWENALPALVAGGVVLAVLTSTEYRTDVVDGYYTTLLRRPTPPARGGRYAACPAGPVLHPTDAVKSWWTSTRDLIGKELPLPIPGDNISQCWGTKAGSALQPGRRSRELFSAGKSW
jgi:hypothetical protein